MAFRRYEEKFRGYAKIARSANAGSTMLKRTASPADVDRVAAFAASDHARRMTATALNISRGTMVD
ncbi:hypothetical protein BS329_13235 [Amycolatopsis coloradensis]|uniref:Uncharacterized protein n=1 Tax=Amycolatopsis coloradensis TaxID=76021 RepID=A0A1R0KXG8_9PSEU|nr:hypothetical protein BS329_13235 [Amycolatopsis coloradensis]